MMMRQPPLAVQFLLLPKRVLRLGLVVGIGIASIGAGIGLDIRIITSTLLVGARIDSVRSFSFSSIDSRCHRNRNRSSCRNLGSNFHNRRLGTLQQENPSSIVPHYYTLSVTRSQTNDGGQNSAGSIQTHTNIGTNGDESPPGLVSKTTKHRLKTGGHRNGSSWQVWKVISWLEESLSFDKNGSSATSEGYGPTGEFTARTTPDAITNTTTTAAATTTKSLPWHHPAPRSLVMEVVAILRKLAKNYGGDSEWKGVLNKSTLLHEVEESIVALHFLKCQLLALEESDSDNRTTNKTHPSRRRREMIVVDACCGKGVFSLLCSYVFAARRGNGDDEEDDNNNENNDLKLNCSQTSIRKIIMLDKDPKLRWDHIKDTNNDRNENQQRPLIECWPRFNLHEIDEVVDLLSHQVDDSQERNSNYKKTNRTKHERDTEQRESPPIVALAVVGIHLCKTLSPTCIGIVNALGPKKCPCLVLAPCCLPRVVLQSRYKERKPNANTTLLQVRQYETPVELDRRRKAKERRDASMVRGNRIGGKKTRPVSMVRLPPIPGGNYPSPVAGGSTIGIPGSACWKCGELGHQKKDCPSNQSTGKPRLVPPMSLSLDVSGILQEETPFQAYCNLLATSIQRDEVSVRQTNIENGHFKSRNKERDTLAKNWNSERKSIFIVATDAI